MVISVTDLVVLVLIEVLYCILRILVFLGGISILVNIDGQPKYGGGKQYQLLMKS